MKKFLSTLSLLAIVFSPVALAAPLMTSASTTQWDVSGSYVVTFMYQGAPYAHDMTLSEDVATGNITSGSGGYPAGQPHIYAWTVDSGTVVGGTINLTAHYTASADAVNPLTIMHITGTIGLDGSMSGTWSDNYQNGARTGTWSTTSGVANLSLSDKTQCKDSGWKNFPSMSFKNQGECVSYTNHL